MIFVGLGANRPGPGGSPPRTTLARSFVALERHGAKVRRRSRWYRSAPVPASDQDWFVNAVAELETSLDPAALLAALHAVEDEMGRVRGAPNAARSCDLDLLDYDGRIASGQDGGPVLPHPRLHQRLFVLLPLAELAPGWIHPVSGTPVRALIAAAPPGQLCEPAADCGATS